MTKEQCPFDGKHFSSMARSACPVCNPDQKGFVSADSPAPPSSNLRFSWTWDTNARNWRLSTTDMGDGLQAGYDHMAGYYERQLVTEVERLRTVFQGVMSRLADLLDSDQFNNIEAIVLEAGVPFPPESCGGEPMQPVETNGGIESVAHPTTGERVMIEIDCPDVAIDARWVVGHWCGADWWTGIPGRWIKIEDGWRVLRWRDIPQTNVVEPSGALPPAFQSLLNLQPNWDSYGAKRINLACVQKAHEIWTQLAGTWLPVPHSDGTVGLEQHQGGFDIEIDVDLALSPEYGDGKP